MYFLGEVFVEPLNTLLFGLVHCLSILLRTPIIPQGKPVDLIFIDPQLMWNISLLRHQVLDLADCIIVQKAVLISNGQTQRLANGVEITRNSDQRWVACVSSIDLSMRGQDSISSSPAESNSPDLSCAWNRAHIGYELVDEGLRDSFAVLDQPGWQSCSNGCSCLRLVDEGQLLSSFEWGLDALEEVEWNRIALMDIGNVAVEACFGVVVGKQADILEFPAKDYGTVSERNGI
jgi:hypothetical protein